MGFKKRPVIDGKTWTLHTDFYRGIRPFESGEPRTHKAQALKEKLKKEGWLVRIKHGAVVYVRRPDKGESHAKRPSYRKGQSHAKIGHEIIDQMTAISDSFGMPTMYRGDMVHDQQLIMGNEPIHAVIWGIRNTGTHIIILVDRPYTPRVARMFGPGQEYSDFAIGCADAFSKSGMRNVWFYITPSSSRKINASDIKKMTVNWLKQGRDVVTTL